MTLAALFRMLPPPDKGDFMLYDTIDSALGPILFARNAAGITRVHFLDSDKPFIRDESWQQAAEDSLLIDTRRQLIAYFSGTLRKFSLPLSLAGTDFQKRVWKTLMDIPYGKTWSYKQVATASGNQAACRAVGNANNKNKIPIIIP